MMDIKVIDLSESGSKSMGFTWGPSGAEGSATTTFSENVSAGTAGGGGGNVDLPFTFFTRSPFTFNTTIRYLISHGEAKVLASPRVATMSGQQASIHIGDKYPIVYFDPRAGQFQVTYVDIGIKLTVKPTVTADDYIVASISPTVSNLLELVNNQYPHTVERSCETNLRVRDGHTIIIGGMMRQDEKVNINKIPLLGDIPIFGEFFRNNFKSRSTNEVIIMITPKIMR
jgi:type II secretory pathway component GspD/PulD (secretin)